ncbi:hypothetical protein GmHk_16G046201 [Glycine max]|nr:hypothetical protein GmHk_16G046201 [Glycine max]
MASRKRARTDNIPSSSIPAPQSTSIEPNVQHPQTLKVALPKAQLPFVRTNEATPSKPTPGQVEPIPAKPRTPVVNPPLSPELEVVPPSPPLIIIYDASSNEAVAPLDSPAKEASDPPASPVGGIADLSDSSSGEVVALTDSLASFEVLIFTLAKPICWLSEPSAERNNPRLSARMNLEEG